MSDSLSFPQAQTITFNEIPATRRDPDVLVEVRPNYGNVGLLDFPSRIIVLSQMMTGGGAGTAVANTLYPITAGGQGGQLFGRGSIAAKQIATVRKNNPTTPLFAAAVPDATGATAASVQITCAAATLAAGLGFNVRVGGVVTPVAAPAGSNASAVAAAIVAALAANPDQLVNAAAVAGVVTLTAKNAGLCGNEIGVRITDRSDASAPMMAITVGAAPATKGYLAGGVGNPDMSSLIQLIAATWYTDIIAPWNDANNRAEMAADGVRRYGAMVNLDARFWIGITGSYATVAAYGDLGNCIQMIQVGVRGNQEPGWVWAAAYGAMHAFRLANDPSRQSKGIALVGLTAPDDADQWMPQERDLLLNNGISTWTALQDGTVVIGRAITGYLTSNAGVADAAWLDVMTPAVMTRLRYDWRNYVKLAYPQAKLFPDDSVGAEYDDTAVTPRRMRGTWAKRCLDYERAGWIEGSATTVQQGYFVINANDKNRLDMDVVVTTAGNLIIEAVVLEFAA